MKFQISSGAFRDKVALAASVINGKGVYPILQNVLIECVENTLTVTATNLKQIISCGCDVFDSESGRVTVPAKKLLALLGSFPATEVLSFTADAEGKFNIKTQTGEFTLLGLPPDDWPSFQPMAEDCSRFTVPMEHLAYQMNYVKSAICKDTSRPSLNSVFFDFSAECFTTVATDGKRMAHAWSPCPVSDRVTAIVPADAVPAILKLSGENIPVAIDKNSISFIGENATFRSKLAEGTYPAYKQVIPAQLKYLAELDAALLRNVLSMFSAISENEQPVTLLFSSSEIRFSVSNASNGSGSDVIPVVIDNLTEPMEISFNPRYLLDAIGSADKVMIAFNDGLSPVGVSGNDDDSETVVMPVRKK